MARCTILGNHYQMPLVIVYGNPCSGKTTRAVELQQAMEAEGMRVVLINTETLKVKRKRGETREERKARIEAGRKEYSTEYIESIFERFGDPRCTAIICRLPYELPEYQLESVVRRFGRVRDLHMICDREGLPRGYAFVRFRDPESVDELRDREGRLRDMLRCRCVVDRVRCQDNKWFPRRLGGGLGKTRQVQMKKRKILKHSGGRGGR
ncbi:protein KTI12/L-seryl-tRNA(Sec) kinase [Kipferlia bialata]|uniref:Protein KTI12/L-seryl-tRNA(Sec) kinase n=1 Tax=Kipferlia bialata TaxID=797122 RepID=A0A9K3CWQ8_9EUKA|nr:protein KTI12/L-seryl-tRNA(Sec) kinase [Kipferlia bialata]|eukprot:g5250.t1